MSKNLNTIYLLHGDAKLLVEEAFQALIAENMPESNADFNYDLFDAETIDATKVVAAANTLPVFSQKRLIVVRRVEKYLENKKITEGTEGEEDNTASQSSAGAEGTTSDEASSVLLRYAANPNPQAILIMLATKKLDSRRKPFKELAKLVSVQSFVEPQYRDTNTWLQERARVKYQKKISNDAIQHLLTFVGRETALLASELEKAALFCGDNKEITLADVQMLTAQDNMFVVFNFIDALVGKEPQHAIAILEELMRRGEYPAKIIVILAKHMRTLISVKALEEKKNSVGEIAKKIGSNSEYIVQKYIRQGKKIKMSAFVDALVVLAEVDSNTKMGFGDAKNLLLNAVIRIAGIVK